MSKSIAYFVMTYAQLRLYHAKVPVNVFIYFLKIWPVPIWLKSCLGLLPESCWNLWKRGKMRSYFILKSKTGKPFFTLCNLIPVLRLPGLTEGFSFLYPLIFIWRPTEADWGPNFNISNNFNPNLFFINLLTFPQTDPALVPRYFLVGFTKGVFGRAVPGVSSPVLVRLWGMTATGKGLRSAWMETMDYKELGHNFEEKLTLTDKCE